MRVPGAKTVRRAGRWLRGRLTPGPRGAVLLYHRVARPPSEGDPFSLCVTPERFAEQLELLRRRFVPLDLGELANRARAGDLPAGAVAVTFDDGYADNLHAAAPLLGRFQVPATCFAVAGCVGRRFWWQELARRVREPARLRRLHRRLRPLLEAERWAVIEQLEARSDPADEVAGTPAGEVAGTDDDGTDDDGRPCTADELRRLADGGVTVGAHSREHPPLAGLPPARLEDEVAGSKARLEEVLERPVDRFAYPFGLAADVDRRAVDAVRRAGFRLACTAEDDAVGRAADPLRLGRLWVDDVPAAVLERRLRRWIGGAGGAA